MATENEILVASGPVQASNGVLMAENENGDDACATVLVNFLMCMCPSLDVSNYPRFRTLLEGVVQHSDRCLELLENPRFMQDSLWKFEHSMKQYMQMHSWKTTGCTLMFYDLKQDSAPQKLVLGFYCPMGFIFLEVPPTNRLNRFFNYYDIWKALQDFLPDWSLRSEVLQFINHVPSYQAECQYQARDLSDTTENSKVFYKKSGITEIKCITQQVEEFWRSICEKSSWVKSLVKKSDKLYEFIASSALYGKFYKTLKKKKLRLAIVMELEGELKAWLSRLSEDKRFQLENATDIPSIINSNEFWSDGNELLQALAPLFQIPHVMDTLVPTSGFLEVAMEKAGAAIKTHYERHPLKFKPIWDCFENWKCNSMELEQQAASYLSPVYILYQMGVEEDLDIHDGSVWNHIYSLAHAYDDDEIEVLDAEREAYTSISTNPFANISVSELEANHPTVLWSKYGAQFPQLQKCAYKLLSQPSCCLCKQVEKQMSKLGRADNYILRLNALMMEEFRTMGNQVYPPVVVPEMGFL